VKACEERGLAWLDRRVLDKLLGGCSSCRGTVAPILHGLVPNTTSLRVAQLLVKIKHGPFEPDDD
jgi:hypothetical protein